MATAKVMKRRKPDSNGTVRQCFREFITEKEIENKSERTIQNYITVTERFLTFCEVDDSTPIEELSKPLVQEWIASLKQKGMKSTGINCYLRSVRAFLYWCMDECKYLEPYRLKELTVEEQEDKYFTNEELERLVEKPDEKNNSFSTWRTWAMICVILDDGSRIGALLAVKMNDVYIDGNDNSYINLYHTKTGKFLSLPLTADCVAVLKKYVKEWRAEAQDDDYLFCNQSGKQLTYNAARLALEDYCKSRGVTHWNWHGFRHSFAINYISKGGESIKLQKILGHTNMRQTQHYVDKYAVDLRGGLEDASTLATIKKNIARGKTVKRKK